MPEIPQDSPDEGPRDALQCHDCGAMMTLGTHACVSCGSQNLGIVKKAGQKEVPTEKTNLVKFCFNCNESFGMDVGSNCPQCEQELRIIESSLPVGLVGKLSTLTAAQAASFRPSPLEETIESKEALKCQECGMVTEDTSCENCPSGECADGTLKEVFIEDGAVFSIAKQCSKCQKILDLDSEGDTCDCGGFLQVGKQIEEGFSKDFDPEKSEKHKTARRALETPQRFKVCRGCDRLCGTGLRICNKCHAHGFEEDLGSVIRQARRDLSSREDYPEEFE